MRTAALAAVLRGVFLLALAIIDDIAGFLIGKLVGILAASAITVSFAPNAATTVSEAEASTAT